MRNIDNIFKYYISEKVLKDYLLKRYTEIKEQIGNDWANPFQSGQLDMIDEILKIIHDTHMVE